MNRRFIIIAAIGALILAAIGGSLALAIKIRNQSKTPVAVSPQIKKIGSDKVVSPVPAVSSQAIWYFNPDGRLFRINPDGSDRQEYPLPAQTNTVRKILWPNSGQDFIALTSGSAGDAKSYFNSQQKIYVNLPRNIKSIDWLPDSRRIVYIWQSGDGLHQQLAIANPDGTGYSTIKEVYWPDLQVKASPDGKTALLYRAKPEGSINKIYMVNFATGEINTVVDQGNNLEAMWISNNRFLFTQRAITAQPRLYLYDLMLHQATDLDINTTLDKVIGSKDGNTLYAAVPRKDGNGDDFMMQDLTTFHQENYFIPADPIKAKNLMLVGNSLFFVGAADSNLYTISK